MPRKKLQPHPKLSETYEDEVLDWYERNKYHRYTLIGFDGKPYFSLNKGTLGGHSGLRIYGRLDCPSALRFIAKGQYVQHRVFFANEEDAIGAGYRPCAKCLPEKYKEWKSCGPKPRAKSAAR